MDFDFGIFIYCFVIVIFIVIKVIDLKKKNAIITKVIDPNYSTHIYNQIASKFVSDRRKNTSSATNKENVINIAKEYSMDYNEIIKESNKAIKEEFQIDR